MRSPLKWNADCCQKIYILTKICFTFACSANVGLEKRGSTKEITVGKNSMIVIELLALSVCSLKPAWNYYRRFQLGSILYLTTNRLNSPSRVILIIKWSVFPHSAGVVQHRSWPTVPLTSHCTLSGSVSGIGGVHSVMYKDRSWKSVSECFSSLYNHMLTFWEEAASLQQV